MEKRRHIIAGAAVTGLLAWVPLQTSIAIAGTLRVAPVRVEVAANKQFCSLSLSNDSPEPAHVQIRGYSWVRDRDGNDLLDQASGPTINPSIAAIPAGETRLIRCSLPNRSGPVEESYRLLIDELPDVNPAPGTVRTLLRISIPLFRAPTAAAPAIDWSVEKRDGTAKLLLANRGSRHAQILSVVLRRNSSKAEPVRLTHSFYLLAGGTAELPLPSLTVDGISAVELETAQGRLATAPSIPGQGKD